MKKKYQAKFSIIFLFHNIIFSSSLINNINNSIIIEITPTWEINPYYKYSIYTGSLMLNSPKWVFFVKPVVTNKEVGKQILGTEFNRFGINGRITNAYIKYDSGKSSFLSSISFLYKTTQHLVKLLFHLALQFLYQNHLFQN